MKPPYALARTAASTRRPLAVLFEQRSCADCDEMHSAVLNLADTLALLRQFDVVRLDRFGATPLTAPDGSRRSASEWADTLGVAYTPSVLLFDSSGREALRIEGYVRRLHLQSALDYVASGAYLQEPSFQRYIQTRAEALRQQGKDATIW